MSSSLLSTAALRLAAVMLVGALVGGCNTLTRLSEVGDGPQLSKIQNPVAAKDYTPVSLPMPTPRVPENNPNSLWRAGARGFFKDHRAKVIGDILTVKLNLDDKAILENKTERTRDDNEKTGVNSFLGLEAEASRYLPDAVDPSSLMDFSNAHETKGDGSIDRKEEINLTFAAVVTQILPNGALVVYGRQEVRVNSEMRELLVTGVVRPEDIESDNTISHEKIAEMRVAYGGRGTISDLQQPRWGTQIWDIIFPF